MGGGRSPGREHLASTTSTLGVTRTWSIWCAGARGHVLPATDRRHPAAAPWRRSSTPTCSCRRGARPADRPGRPRRSAAGGGAPNSRWREVGADHGEVRAVDVDLGVEQHRADGSTEQLREPIVRARPDRLAGQQRQAPVSVARSVVRTGPAGGSGFGSIVERAIGTATQRMPRASATSSCWATPPSGAQVSCSTMTSASKARTQPSTSNGGKPSPAVPRPQCTLKLAMVSSGTGSSSPCHRLDAGRQLGERVSTGKSCSSGSGSACSRAQVTE